MAECVAIFIASDNSIAFKYYHDDNHTYYFTTHNDNLSKDLGADTLASLTVITDRVLIAKYLMTEELLK